MGSRLSFAVLNVFIRRMNNYSPTKKLFVLNQFILYHLFSENIFFEKSKLKQPDHL